jgi:hypothetical protein
MHAVGNSHFLSNIGTNSISIEGANKRTYIATIRCTDLGASISTDVNSFINPFVFTNIITNFYAFYNTIPDSNMHAVGNSHFLSNIGAINSA